MRVLVVHGSKMGGTAGIAEMLAESLRVNQVQADVRPAREVRDVASYDGVVVGGALYAARWHRDARRFVRRHRAALRERPVWLFSSGPLDDSARKEEIAPVRQVRKAMERVGALEHRTFGGVLAEDARGFIASRMARDVAGDWRDAPQIARWGHEIADALKPNRVDTV